MTGYNYDGILNSTYIASLSNAGYPGDKSNPSGNYRLISSKDKGAQNVNNKILFIEHVNIGKLRNFAVNPTYNTIEYKFSDFVTSLHENFRYLNTELENIKNSLNGDNTTIYVPEPEPEPEPTQPTNTSYYFYVGLTKPTSSTTIGTPVTGQQMGWHLIGDSIDGYSVASPVYAGSVPSQTINVNPDYDDVDFYAAVPVGLSLHDGLGNIIDSLFLDTANVTINGHSYNIFKIYNSDFLATIY